MQDTKENEAHAGIDIFRLIAAVLIITIHTSPLSSVSRTADFILTRFAARVAVPFFFMTSGFFLIRRYERTTERLKAFVKKTAFLYAFASVLYLPINIYSGYFKSEALLPNIVKDIVFDGTFYHLWYLPASIIGASIAWWLIRRLGFSKGFFVTALLYLIGLFGDSYYGIAENSVVLKGFYGLLFQVSDYTRNGIFFAPVFFVLGGLIADRRAFLSLGKSVLGFAVSFCLMLGEAMLLHEQGLQRHDSMYLLLLPAMFFLFHVILCFRGKRLCQVRELALTIYIIHPFMIVAVRFLAKLCGWERLLINNSIVHFAAVCLSSVSFSIVVMFCCKLKHFIYIKYLHTDNKAQTDRAYIEINLNNLEHNVRQIRGVLPPGCELMAVVKTGAYGHGAFEISTHLDKIGVRAFAVATIDEGINLRKYGVRGEILILGYTNPQRAGELKRFHLTQTIIDFEYALALNRQGVAVQVHIKLDTGMHRLGISADSVSQAEQLFKMKNLHVNGIFTHLSCADSLSEEDVAFTRGQIDCFYKLVRALKEKGIAIPKLHIQSSYGLLNYPELTCDYVRVGIALYGVLSTADNDTGQSLDLRPVLSLKARVILVRKVKSGEGVGYGRAFTAAKDSKLALLSVGYGDGFPRQLSGGKSGVMINGGYAPIVGRICMDALIVDVTDIGNVAVGDVATLIGGDGAEGERLAAPAVAGRAESISNELLCRMGVRLPVVAVI